MIKAIHFFIPLCFSAILCVAQPNCNIYKWKGDNACYHACLESLQAIEFEQGSKESQLHFDKSIELCPSVDYAYFEKAVPYLKRGEFITWKKLIDKAVELNPTGNLGYRGWCRYQFLRDYEGAINDIEKLEALVSYDIGYCINGNYHLNITKALCYKGLGDNKKAIEIFEKQLSEKGYDPSLYDFFHLGVLKLEIGDYLGSIVALKKEIEINDYLADTYYYLALAYKSLNNKAEYEQNIFKAKEYYGSGKRLTDPYTEPMDKIYRTDIEKEIISSLSSSLKDSIIKALFAVDADDQKFRNQMDYVQNKFGGKSTEMKTLMGHMKLLDSLNLIKIEGLINKYGWLGESIIGSQGNTTLFMVIQHSDLKTQEKYLPMIRQAVTDGNAKPHHLAMLEDRVALLEGKRQVYGSQVGWDMNTNTYYVLPLEEPENVDKRRAEVGLPPLKDYLNEMNTKWDLEQYKKDLPMIEAKFFKKK